jgi:hypothetical protein
MFALATERHFLRVDQIRVEDRDRGVIGRYDLQRCCAAGKHLCRPNIAERILA